MGCLLSAYVLGDTSGLRLVDDVCAGLRIACRYITCTQNTQYMAPNELHKGDTRLPNELQNGDK